MLATPTARFKLFNAFGVPVHADYSAALLLALVLLMNGRGGPSALVASLVIAAVAFLSLIGHELGHAFAVKKLGYGRSQIVLGGFGGVCKWYGRPTRGDSIRIALAGPAASLVMGAIALAVFLPLRPQLDGLYLLRVGLLAAAFLNIVWGVFNLLPIFPMDGGRALRSALGFKYSTAKALRLSLIVSGVVGVTVAIVAYLMGHLFASVLLLFLLFQNWNEWQNTQA